MQKDSQGLNDPWGPIAATCEQLLIDSGREDEAYRRFAFEATTATTYLARFRTLVRNPVFLGRVSGFDWTVNPVSSGHRFRF